MRQFDLNDLVSTFKYEGIKVQLFWDGKCTSTGQCQYSYIASYKGQELLRGADMLVPASMAAPDSKEAMINYLCWLIVQEGDTDKEFFKDYSPAALDFVNNNSSLDQVRVRIWDWESGELVPKKMAERWFNKRIKI